MRKGKQMMRKVAAFSSGLLFVFPMVACGVHNGGVEDNEKNCVIQMFLGGYGDLGMKAVAKRFNEIYNEEGYVASVSSNTNLTAQGVYQQLQLGTDDPTDLYFGAADIAYIVGEGANFVKSTSYPHAIENLNDLYNETKVYGEDVLFKDKVNPTSLAFERQTDGGYYAVNWATGVTGFAYNANLVEQYNYTLPRTTQELFELMEQIKADKNIPFVFCGSACSYFDYPALVWWRQFASDEEVKNFWNCQVEDETGELIESAEAFKTYARLQAFTNVEKCIYDSANIHPESMTFDKIGAQAELYKKNSNVMFMPIGDWLENEMSEIGASGNIRFMKIPVTSEVLTTDGVTPRFATITTEAQLREVISAIDAGEQSYQGVSAEDYANLTRIRNFCTSEGFSHQAVIPSHANAKEVAKLFLAFLASDEAIRLYYQASNCFLPFNTEGADLGEKSNFTKDVQNIMSNAEYVSMYDSKNPLFYKTDLSFNLTKYFMDGKIGTTNKADKLTGHGWWEMVYKDVEDNLNLYQSLVKV